MHRLSTELTARMARLAIENIVREYPSAPGHLLRSADDLRAPRRVHPAFFGSYDWHSCVHQHWLLIRLLRLGLIGSDADAARSVLATTLTPDNLAVEAAYLRERPTFERTYGWAWLLKLCDELRAWDAPEAAPWADALAPVVDAVRTNWLAFLPHATYPIRAGTHANSAFGLALALDHAADDPAFADALRERALTWFANDRDYPAHIEPGGDDFLSGALMEAALMTRLLDRSAFARWFEDFMQDVPATLLQPAIVSDRSDPKTVHLDGLNLSRAWCWRRIASALPSASVAPAADAHLDVALPHLFTGAYTGEHWLSSFALLALTD